MGTQLYNDAVLPAHHKYAAHQIALLYVSSNHVQCNVLLMDKLVVDSCMLTIFPTGYGERHSRPGRTALDHGLEDSPSVCHPRRTPL